MKKTDLAATIVRDRRFGVRAVAHALQVSRSNLTERLKPMQKRVKFYCKQEDEILLPYIHEIINKKASYGYRRVTTLLNQRLLDEGKKKANHKRIYRIMKQHNLLLPIYGKRPARTHEGKVITLHSNKRWCSDTFIIQCFNGDRVFVAFAIDSCDREVMSYIASTIGIDGSLIRDLMLESIEHRFGKISQLPNTI